jgi:thymidine phosphorylase
MSQAPDTPLLPSAKPAVNITTSKRAGERLNREDFGAIIRDIAELHYSKIELSAFVVATNREELD